MKKHLPRFLIPIFLIFICTVLFPTPTFANGDLKYYLGSTVNTGKDNGYSESNPLEEKDPHFGWTLGKFFVSGYTSDTVDDNGNKVFLKTVGDTVTLWFHLDQDITKLNGDETLTIAEDENGYDKYFGIEKTNFGRGTLIIRHTDYQNLTSDPIIYTDYLAANATAGADVQVELFEEGDYEVALNYEIVHDARNLFGISILPTTTNYRIFFRFSIRNGNCMVYPFDISTNAELTNSSITENGFYLDLANSRYLDINIKKEVLNEGTDGLTEDTRFNRPAKDGAQFTEEGIYTITVSNRYTDQETVKKIYVGTNNILKAHVTTGLSITEIETQIAMGASISDDGTIITTSSQTNHSALGNNTISDDDSSQDYPTWKKVVIVIAVIFLLLLLRILQVRIRRSRL